jgi:hypothetical protein
LKISKIILYDEPSVPEIKLKELVNFLQEIFPVIVETRENILSFASKDIAPKIAECKIFNLSKDFQKHVPTEEEILFEESNIQDTSKTENIIMYDGFYLQSVLANLISEEEQAESIFHVFFTNKLTCTYDNNDYRYHGRSLIGSNPAIISTTGIIEATYLEYNDSRLSKIIEGYLLQAIFYYETGEPFCNNSSCRLFNAHWQKDLLHSQLHESKLCEIHQKVLKKIIQK